jgi:hypothetical protein
MLRAMRLGPFSSTACWVLLAACAYPRHTTPLHVAGELQLPLSAYPGGMYSFQLLSAELPPTKMSGLPWDDDGSGPDCFVRLYVDDRQVWQSEVVNDQPRPEWNEVAPRNLVIPSSSSFRLELWDRDTAISGDPIAALERRGLPPTAMPGARARLQLDRASTVVILVSAPRAHRGVGLSVEVRDDFLKVLAVERFSPAARGGIAPGDHIVGIGPSRVASMSEGDKMGELSLAAERHHTLSVTDANGRNEREVALDDGFVWLVL